MVLFASIFFLSFISLSLIFLKGAQARLIYTFSGLVVLALCILSLQFPLPFSGSDAATFEEVGWYWSQGGLATIWRNLDVSASYFISTITAYIYYFTGREPILPILMNGVLGLLILLNSLRLFDELWGRGASNRMLFFLLVAFSPMLTIHSAVLLRENYVGLFLLLAAIQLVRFVNRNNPVYLFALVFYTMLASFFHGGAVVFLVGLPFYFLLVSKRYSALTKIGWLFVAVAGLAVLFATFSFGKLSGFQESGFSGDFLVDRLQSTREANTAYMDGIVPTSPVDLAWQAPLRLFFFLFKPFVWDIRAFGHAIVWLDALVWAYIFLTLYRYRKAISANPAAVALLVCCLVACLVFAIGTSNYGTAVRHRTKFFVEMLVIVAPFLWVRKKRRSRYRVQQRAVPTST